MNVYQKLEKWLPLSHHYKISTLAEQKRIQFTTMHMAPRIQQHTSFHKN